MVPRRVWVILVVLLLVAACTGTSDAPTARFSVLQYPEDGDPAAGSRYEGEGDFAAGEVVYTLLVEGEPAIERRELGDITHVGWVGEEVYYESEDTPEALASRALRNGLAASTDALSFLQSIADEVSEVGQEVVRGTETTHFRAVGQLSKLGAPPEDNRFPIEVWIDEGGRTRRYRYQPLGGGENIVWEFYDFGVSVDVRPPPPEKVRG